MSFQFSSNLDTLLGQNDDNLKIQYEPYRESKLTDKNYYHRKYDGDISIELDERPFTREMKTALVKRWLLINKKKNEPQFQLHRYLETNEVISCLFHLMELGDENADNLYIYVNDIIKGSEGLLDWLNREFKDSSFRLTRRQRLRFKYLYTKYTTNTEFQVSTQPDKLFLTDIEEKLPETNKLDRLQIIEVINKARNTYDYTSKRQLVDEYLEFFKIITSKLEHFDILMDVEYFFLVFEKLIEDNDVTQRALKRMLSQYRNIANNTFTPPLPPRTPRVSLLQPEQETVLESTEPNPVSQPDLQPEPASPGSVPPETASPAPPGSEKSVKPDQVPTDLDDELELSDEQLAYVIRTLEEYQYYNEAGILNDFKSYAELDDLTKIYLNYYCGSIYIENEFDNYKKTLFGETKLDDTGNNLAVSMFYENMRETDLKRWLSILFGIEKYMQENKVEPEEGFDEKELERIHEFSTEYSMFLDKQQIDFKSSSTSPSPGPQPSQNETLSSTNFAELQDFYDQNQYKLGFDNLTETEKKLIFSNMNYGRTRDIIKLENFEEKYESIDDDIKIATLYAVRKCIEQGQDLTDLNIFARGSIFRNAYKLFTDYIHARGQQLDALAQTRERQLNARKQTVYLNPIYSRGESFKSDVSLKYSFDGLYIVDRQDILRCGLHAINNLLQILNPKCLITYDNPELKKIITPPSQGHDGNNIQSSDLIQIINRNFNDNFIAEYIPANATLPEYQRIIDDPNFKGIIERKPGHYVAWVIRDKYWYRIDSFGDIQKYPLEDGTGLLQGRRKVIIDAHLVNGTYEHILVKQNAGDITRFEQECIKNPTISDELSGRQTTQTALRPMFLRILDNLKTKKTKKKTGGSKIRSKKRHFHKSNLKSKKKNYN